MNLDLAIQNVMKRSEMEGAMHGVMSNFGASYELMAYTDSAKSAENILGVTVGHMAPNAMSRPVMETKRAEVYTATPPTQDVSTTIGPMELSYTASSRNWTLSSMGQPTFWNKLFGTAPSSKILITKYGTNASHRFLSAVENSGMSASSKNQIASFVMTHMQSTSVRAYQQGLTVDTQPLDDAITSSTSRKVLEANYTNGSQEMGLAQSYTGVAKLSNNTFMGDTVIPQPLSAAQVGTVRTALGDPVGVHISPPTRHMGAIKTNRSL
jgi:hypothetical protein